MIFQNKKALMSLAIVLLVFATLVLVIFSIYVFNFRQTGTIEAITSFKEVDALYADSELLNFYLRDICSKISSKTDPVAEFKNELQNYKLDSGEYVFPILYQIESQVDAEHIWISNNGELIVEFDSIFKKTFRIDEQDLLGANNAEYHFPFKYSRKLG